MTDYLAIARKIGEPILAEYPNSKNGDVFSSRRFSGVVTKAIELVLTAQADADSAVAQAKAIHKISEKQWAVVAGWIREAAERIVAAVAEKSNAGSVRKKKASATAAAELSNGDPVRKRRGRPPKGERALTPAEHQRRYRLRKKQREQRPKVPASAEAGIVAEKSIRLTRLAVSVIELLHIIESSRIYDGEPLSPEVAAALRDAATRAGGLALPGATDVEVRRLGEPAGVEQVQRVRKQLAERERRFAAGKP